MKTMRRHILTHICLLLSVICAPAMVAQLSVDAPSGLIQRKTTGRTASEGSNKAASAPAKDATPAAPAQHQSQHSKANSSVSVTKDGNKLRVQSQTVQRNISGYRVQVYFSSAKDGKNVARRRAKQVAMKYPQYRTYVSYVAPQWRLRVGDFKDIKLAQKFASRLRSSFSGFRREVVVVPDKINVWGN